MRKATPVARIFLSSRFGEMASLRDEICRQAQHSSDIEIVNLSDGSASVQSPLGRSLKEVAASDLFVLLLGSTYSEDPAADPATNPSVTHREWLESCERGIPVLPYQRKEAQVTPAAGAFWRAVAERSVVGELSPVTHQNDRHDAAAVIADVRDALPLLVDSEEDEQPATASFQTELQREFRYLGLEHSTKRFFDEDRARATPQLASQAEQVVFGHQFIEQGQVSQAISHFEQAYTMVQLTWEPAYVLARLLEYRNQRGDRQRALKVAEQAVRSVQASGAEGVSGAVGAQRNVATLLLASRLRAACGDQAGAHELALAALDARGFSQDALAQVVLTGAVEHTKGAAGAFRTLMNMYPDGAVRLLRDPRLSPVRDELDSRFATQIRGQHDKALASLGFVNGVAALPAAEQLAGYRAFAADQRKELGDRLTPLLSQLSAAGPTFVPDAIAKAGESSTSRHALAFAEAQRTYAEVGAAAGAAGVSLPAQWDAAPLRQEADRLAASAAKASSPSDSEDKRLGVAATIGAAAVGSIALWIGLSIVAAVIGALHGPKGFFWGLAHVLPWLTFLLPSGWAIYQSQQRNAAAASLARARSLRTVAAAIEKHQEAAATEQGLRTNPQELTSAAAAAADLGRQVGELTTAKRSFDEAFSSFAKWAFPEARSLLSNTTSRQPRLVYVKPGDPGLGKLEQKSWLGPVSSHRLMVRSAGRLLDAAVFLPQEVAARPDHVAALDEALAAKAAER